ncbi:MAG TPA: multicopper oxidase domain-containing protein [Steroidobacteraceae bacterium]|nr:multicopper oxidase domain-containing protein [Steroidobacteraceae bacterium]
MKVLGLLALGWSGVALGQPVGCPARPAEGSLVGEPEDLRSVKGVLRVDLEYRSSVGADGQTHYCYVAPDGSEAPTLRLRQGDLLILRLKNAERAAAAGSHHHGSAHGCTTGAMDATATNLHFHGLTVPPVCHQDDVLNTSIEPGEAPFEYRFRIPAAEPPGLYWYHPHIHGVTKAQVLGGASGALIVEGIEQRVPALAGLAERVLIIRDQELLHPDAAPVQTDSMPPPMVMRDAEGDILNTGTGGGKPAKDLSINFVAVAYPHYVPATIKLRPGERQLWRVLNASAITYLDLQLLLDARQQALGVVSLDGVPITQNGTHEPILWRSHALIPPAGRVELLVRGPPEGKMASLVTRTVDTGPAGENDPTRPIATLIADAAAPEPRSRFSSSPRPAARSSAPSWLGDVTPARTRRLYFSEKPHDPHDPNSPTDFFITVDGREPRLFDPARTTPDIVVHQGDVEDWVIENRTQELHAFHIHQVHFMLLDWNGIPLDEPFLRDTVNVAYWDGKSPQYPSVRLRMDFRDPHSVGTFVYHCHLLEHEDGGMMGLIRVLPVIRR